MTVPTLLITGSVGVGKTTVALECTEILEARNVPHAFFDLDGLTYFHPKPPDDRFGSRVAMRGLSLVWPLMRAQGADRLILARVIEARQELGTLEEAIPGAEVIVVRLSAPLLEIEGRLRGREIGAGLGWHIARAAELEAHWQSNRVEDLVVETSGRTVRELALEILDRVHW